MLGKYDDQQQLAFAYAMGDISKEEYERLGGKFKDPAQEAAKQAEKDWKKAEAGNRAWNRMITIEVPPGSTVPGPTQRCPLLFAIQSVRDGATRQADKILAAGLLAIIEEMELHTGPARKEITIGDVKKRLPGC